MFDLMKPRIAAVSSGVVGLSVVAASLVALTTVGSADASQQRAARSSTNQATTSRSVASTSASQVYRTSLISGRTASGRMVTGGFRPRSVTNTADGLVVKGRLRAVIHRLDGSTRTIIKHGVSFPVKSINGNAVAPAQNRAASPNLAGPSAAAAAGACPVLNLVLGPLDLDLLGLQVHLDKVVLDIIAQSGPGKLLGNLLCAVAGLLDGTPLSGLLSQLAVLLNSILAILNA